MPHFHGQPKSYEFSVQEIAELREILADWRDHKKYLEDSTKSPTDRADELPFENAPPHDAPPPDAD